MMFRVDDDVILVCEVIFDFIFMLKWECEGEFFLEGCMVRQGGKLEIKGIQKDDYGVYMCIVILVDGQVKYFIIIVVICKLYIVICLMFEKQMF